MECCHGVIGMGHELAGNISFPGETVLFDRGWGYIGKAWGKSMPQAWIWNQSNHFEEGMNASFILSVARIPWTGSSFTDFLGYLHTGQHLYRFVTYAGTRLKSLHNTADLVEVVLENKKIILYISVVKGKSGNLLAPVVRDMSRAIHESIDGRILLKLTGIKGKVLF